MTWMMMLMMMLLMMMMLTMRQPPQQDPGALVVHAACCRPQAIPRDLQHGVSCMRNTSTQTPKPKTQNPKP
jgi:hypothetical protein